MILNFYPYPKRDVGRVWLLSREASKVQVENKRDQC